MGPDRQCLCPDRVPYPLLCALMHYLYCSGSRSCHPIDPLLIRIRADPIQIGTGCGPSILYSSSIGGYASEDGG